MKSQASLEFITNLSIMIAIYIIIIGIYSYFSSDYIYDAEVGRELCYIMSSAINSAVIGGENFTLVYTIPYSIGKPTDAYFLISNQSLVTVYWGKRSYSCTIITQNVTSGKVVSGEILVKNYNRSIYVSSLLTDKRVYNLGEEVNITGYYFDSNVTFDILFNNVSLPGYPKYIIVVNNSFNDSFTPTERGSYVLVAKEDSEKYLSIKRIIDVV